jgi:hypothetical protein
VKYILVVNIKLLKNINTCTRKHSSVDSHSIFKGEFLATIDRKMEISSNKGFYLYMQLARNTFLSICL